MVTVGASGASGTIPGWCYVTNPPDPVEVVGKNCTKSIRFIDELRGRLKERFEVLDQIQEGFNL